MRDHRARVLGGRSRAGKQGRRVARPAAPYHRVRVSQAKRLEVAAMPGMNANCPNCGAVIGGVPARADPGIICRACGHAFVAPGTVTVEPAPRPDTATVTLASPSVPPGPPPERLGRFEVRRFVGEGAFGRVYEA